MALLKVLTYPDKFLKKTAKPVDQIDDELHKLIDDMNETMFESVGVGLAATQVGIDKRLIVFDITPPEEDRNPQVLINPEIVTKEGEYLSESEGCLSVPEFRADVKRSESVVVKATNRAGKEIEIKAEGLLAVVFQHEIDHLNGILFIDRVSGLKKDMYTKKIKKQLKQEAAEKG